MFKKIHKFNGANGRSPLHKRYRKYPVGARPNVPVGTGHCPVPIYRIVIILFCFLFVFEQTGFAQIAGQLDISDYLAGLRNSFAPDKFRPPHLRYLQYLPEQNSFRLLIDVGTGFLPACRQGLKPVPTGAVDSRNASVGTEYYSVPTVNARIEEETKTLLSYFFIGLTLSNDSFWVNLRPDSPDNIIDPLLAQTDIGKILLEADVQLKKDTAKYTSPETPEGREYWDKLYQKAGELFGSENITIPTLTRPWIVPDEIIIREAEDNAYVYKATLKVMLEDDYLNNDSGKNDRRGGFITRPYKFSDSRLKQLNAYSSQLIRELIIPKLTKEINASRRYAPLRQVYYSLILAQWFKTRFGNESSRRGGFKTLPYNADGTASVGTEYHSVPELIDSKDLTGITSKEPYSKETYFNQYQKSFQKGEYNIKEPRYTPYGQTIRSYFSGGINIIAKSTEIISGQGPIEGKQPYEIEIMGAGSRLFPIITADGNNASVGARHAVPGPDLELSYVSVGAGLQPAPPADSPNGSVGTGHRSVRRATADDNAIPLSGYPKDNLEAPRKSIDGRYHELPDGRLEGAGESSSPVPMDTTHSVEGIRQALTRCGKNEQQTVRDHLTRLIAFLHNNDRKFRYKAADLLYEFSKDSFYESILRSIGGGKMVGLIRMIPFEQKFGFEVPEFIVLQDTATKQDLTDTFKGLAPGAYILRSSSLLEDSESFPIRGAYRSEFIVKQNEATVPLETQLNRFRFNFNAVLGSLKSRRGGADSIVSGDRMFILLQKVPGHIGGISEHSFFQKAPFYFPALSGVTKHNPYNITNIVTEYNCGLNTRTVAGNHIRFVNTNIKTGKTTISRYTGKPIHADLLSWPEGKLDSTQLTSEAIEKHFVVWNYADVLTKLQKKLTSILSRLEQDFGYRKLICLPEYCQ